MGLVYLFLTGLERLGLAEELMLKRRLSVFAFRILVGSLNFRTDSVRGLSYLLDERLKFVKDYVVSIIGFALSKSSLLLYAGSIVLFKGFYSFLSLRRCLAR